MSISRIVIRTLGYLGKPFGSLVIYAKRRLNGDIFMELGLEL